MKIRPDCRYYRGHKPCKFKRACEGCNFFEPMGMRILIIKLGALGDLLRSTPLLTSLRAAHPNAQITWLTEPRCVALLQNLPEIDRVWSTDASCTARVLAETFDWVIGLDKDAPASELTSLANAKRKSGFMRAPNGALVAANSASEYALRLGIDDHLKFKINTQTYPEMIHAMVELPYSSKAPVPYLLRLTDAERASAKATLAPLIKKAWKPRGPQRADQKPFLIGVHAGCGDVFETKRWFTDRFAQTMATLQKRQSSRGVLPVLLGGTREAEINDQIARTLKRQRIPFVRPGESGDLRTFAAVVGSLQGIICGDTLPLHLALAQQVPAVAIFTSTCAQEIEFYGLGTSVVGQAPCAPCYLNVCPKPEQYCALDVRVEAVVKAFESLLEWNSSDHLRDRTDVQRVRKRTASR